MNEDNETIRFTVHCTMKRRWASQFIGMLKRMQHLGSIGSSRNVIFYADGDGDFRPQFECEDQTINTSDPALQYKNGDTLFDAG